MNLDDIAEIREPLQRLIDSGSRINSKTEQRYWYPLSMATYDVEEVLAAVDSLCSFRTTMWEKTALFEQRFAAEVQGTGEAVMVNSGSSADLLIAFALTNPAAGLCERGDEVLVPSVTWPTQLWSVMMAGLEPTFVDTDPVTLNVDLDDLEAKITPRTRAISLVHLMGNPVDMDRVMALAKKHDLVVVEDCCESLGAAWNGAPVGTFGVAGAFSFFFSHHITTMEGGMITCRDEGLSDLFRLLRAHGWARNTRHTQTEVAPGIDPRYTFINWGFNVRPTELSAAFGLVQLDRLRGFHEQRQESAAYFSSLLAAHGDLLKLMEVADGGECSWFALPIMLAENAPFERDALVQHLEAEGVETRPIVAGSLARHPVSNVFPVLRNERLPGADAVHDRGFYLGLHPFASKDKLDRLIEVIESFVTAST